MRSGIALYVRTKIIVKHSSVWFVIQEKELQQGQYIFNSSPLFQVSLISWRLTCFRLTFCQPCPGNEIVTRRRPWIHRFHFDNFFLVFKTELTSTKFIEIVFEVFTPIIMWSYIYNHLTQLFYITKRCEVFVFLLKIFKHSIIILANDYKWLLF